MSDFPTHPMVLELAAGRPIIDPPQKRTSWYTTRLFVNVDGTTSRVLDALAERLYPDLNPRTYRAIWKDMDWRNETPENVGTSSEPGERRRSAFGVPAGTRDYWKAYRAANRAKVREYQAKSIQKRRAAVAAAREKQANEISDSPFAAQMGERLAEILANLPSGQSAVEALTNARASLTAQDALHNPDGGQKIPPSRS